MSLSDEDLTHLLTLARLSATEADRVRLKRDVNDILRFVERLLDADVAGEAPMSHGEGTVGTWRADEARSGPFAPDPLELAPKRRDGHVVVPRVLDRDAT